MKITASQLSFNSERSYEEQRVSKRSVETLEDRISLDGKQLKKSGKERMESSFVNIASRKRPRLFSRLTEIPAPNPEEQINGDPRLAAMKRMIESMTGKKIKLDNIAGFNKDNVSGSELASANDLSSMRSPGIFNRFPPNSSIFSVNTPFSSSSFNSNEVSLKLSGQSLDMPDIPVQKVRITEVNSLYEAETTKFQAQGTVRNASGEEINFSLNLDMAREYYSEERIQMTGDAVLVDPLVVNFGGSAADLTDVRFKFDLNSDGDDEEMIPWLKSGSGFLVFDRNKDGVVNNGSELFGPQSQNGFEELAQLDEDGNGWIDEGDSAFESLSVWSGASPETATLQGIRDKGIGAISVSSAETLFAVKEEENNSTLGQIRRTGIYLEENGKAGTIQQLDLSV
ncbi:hypothetical protein MTBBW1_1410027 [Desulfamplus magnetovallimortis]|uniref:VCBS repeat-containing protein n=1 Tax=Desulfamplus magnetovallimortis TaxID=1246637 RepID=A0A1W1H804_9BACT|nr:hypothetical protein [Desulfamplus magnetovallimortis]SLM28610.1 hypothetical protein MTBBW1_1410027 [Desulfamplus magnetovallimortis]